MIPKGLGILPWGLKGGTAARRPLFVSRNAFLYGAFNAPRVFRSFYAPQSAKDIGLSKSNRSAEPGQRQNRKRFVLYPTSA